MTFVVKYEFDSDHGLRLCGLDLHDKMKDMCFETYVKATLRPLVLRKRSEKNPNVFEGFM